MSTIKTASGLLIEDLVVGNGATAAAGQRVSVHYTGWLDSGGKPGAKFDSSKDRGQPFMFSLGRGEVIRGWEEGVTGMKVGGARRIVIPPSLAYGNSRQNSIPPYATLVFDIDLVDIVTAGS